MRNLKRCNRKGFTLVELVLVLAIAGVIAIGLLVLYNTTVRPSAWINDKVQSFTNLQAALEQARTINGGRYPLVTSSIYLNSITGTDNASAILRSVLGPSNPQYTGWTYSCSGGTLTIGIYVGDDANVDRKNAVRMAIMNNFNGTGWVCDTSAMSSTTTIFTCSRSNVPCG